MQTDSTSTRQTLQPHVPDAYYGSLDRMALGHWVRNKLLTRWDQFMASLPPNERRLHHGILLWDAAPQHRALASDGDLLAENLYAFTVPAETTCYIQVPDVGGVFRSLKAQVLGLCLLCATKFLRTVVISLAPCQ